MVNLANTCHRSIHTVCQLPQVSSVSSSKLRRALRPGPHVMPTSVLTFDDTRCYGVISDAYHALLIHLPDKPKHALHAPSNRSV